MPFSIRVFNFETISFPRAKPELPTSWLSSCLTSVDLKLDVSSAFSSAILRFTNLISATSTIGGKPVIYGVSSVASQGYLTMTFSIVCDRRDHHLEDRIDLEVVSCLNWGALPKIVVKAVLVHGFSVGSFFQSPSMHSLSQTSCCFGGAARHTYPRTGRWCSHT